MQRKVTIKKKSPAKKTTPKKNTPNKAKRTPKKEVATQIIFCDLLFSARDPRMQAKYKIMDTEPMDRNFNNGSFW